jgi:hypothetical protein
MPVVSRKQFVVIAHVSIASKNNSLPVTVMPRYSQEYPTFFFQLELLV